LALGVQNLVDDVGFNCSRFLVLVEFRLSLAESVRVIPDGDPVFLQEAVTDDHVDFVLPQSEGHAFLEFVDIGFELERNAEVVAAGHLSQHFGGTYKLEGQFFCGVNFVVGDFFGEEVRNSCAHHQSRPLGQNLL
jgi:hypothetical protein